MKRIWLLLLSSAMVTSFLVGCTPAAEKPVVMQKDMEQMVQMAVNNNAPSLQNTLSNRLAAPSQYKAELVDELGNLHIHVDANLILPDTDKLPVAKVRPSQFSQQQVTAFFLYFCKDTVMYDAGRSGRTRAELEREILSRKKSMNDDKDYANRYQALQAFLEEEYANAPENIEDTRSDGTLREMLFNTSKPDIGRYMGVNAVENPYERYKGKQFFVRNDMDMMDWADESVDWGKETNASMDYSNTVADTKFPPQGYQALYTYITDESTVPEEARGSLSITPAEARREIEALLQATDSGLLTNGVYLMEAKPHPEDGSPDQPSNYAYTVTCGRVINGIPCRTVAEANANNYKNETSMTPSWFYELVTFEIIDNGVRRFSWRAPMEIAEIIAEDAALLPFEDIAEIFKRMLLVVWEVNATDEYIASRDISVTRIALELQRVTEKDAVNGGIVIPVWNFYGDILTQYKDDELESTANSNRLPRSFLTINAIDGSVIDAHRGY